MKNKALTRIYTAIVCLAALTACNTARKESTFDQQAHRGGRGLMPENTISAEKNAIKFGCTLEMDLQMSKDKKVVVSHDAFFSSQFCLTPEGDTMTKKDARSRMIYNMPYDSIKQYDVGLKPHPEFPGQKKIPAIKPLLAVLIDSVEAFGKTQNNIPRYNIELETNPKWDGKQYPDMAEYVDSCMAVIIRKGIAARTMIQSFDVRALRRVHDRWPDIAISYLVYASNKQPVNGYVKDLGFKPDIFSPYYKNCTAERIKQFHAQGIRVIPWTINTVAEMQKLKDMGVDGEITDFPTYYAQLQ